MQNSSRHCFMSGYLVIPYPCGRPNYYYYYYYYKLLAIYVVIAKSKPDALSLMAVLGEIGHGSLL
jgi:hypothetical protein